MIPSDLNSYYRLHSKFYNSTRWAFLFGRNKVSDFLPALPDHARILDLGCGTGKHLSQLREKYPASKIVGLDQSIEMLNHVIESSVVFRNEEYSKASFEPNSFDLILGSYSLSMMQNIDEVLESVMLHLKKSGMLLIVDFDSTPFNWFSRWMEKNHVHFNAELFKKLEDRFDIEYTEVYKAYFGLYTYTIYFGKNW